MNVFHISGESKPSSNGSGKTDSLDWEDDFLTTLDLLEAISLDAEPSSGDDRITMTKIPMNSIRRMANDSCDIPPPSLVLIATTTNISSATNNAGVSRRHFIIDSIRRPLDEPNPCPNSMDFKIDTARKKATGACTGWLMTSVASWGETKEDAFDQCLVELGLGDSRLIRMEGAMLPMGFEPTQPENLAMGSLVECHIAESFTYDGGTASAGVAWAQCVTPEGDECAIVATIASGVSYEETELLLKRTLKQKLASRDLEVVKHQIAVDEVTAADEHHGCAIAALILPETLNMQSGGVGRVRGGLTRSADGFNSGKGTNRQATTTKSGDFSF